MDFLRETIFPHVNFYFYVVLMMIGLFAMISKNNLIKKLIGMSIFQTAIILFYVSLSVKEGATIPIIEHGPGYGDEKELVGGDGQPAEPTPKVIQPPNPDHHANPLPHVLMLTAIVVGVATLGVGLAVSQLLFQDYGTLEEDEILAKIQEEDAARG